ncbi:MAG: diguanylate cyclase [Rhodospirillales bacterium]|jgi:peptide/nickel transport system substrate-binding protein|nr:diguanylate cyclase [Rhodospirillales bacterium]
MRKTLGRVIGALAVTMALLGGPWEQPAAAQGVLKIARHQDSTTLDPIFTIQNADIWVMNNMNGLLVRVNREGTDVEPDLAERWEISPDGTTYTFHLREGLKFSDGSPLTARDAKFSLERLRDQEGSVMASMFSVIKSIETPDDGTVVITLNQPSAPFLASLAMFSAAVLPEKALAAADNANAGETGDLEFGNNPVGAGAFMLEEWRRGEVLRLKKNPNYWEADRVKLDGVEWQFIPNDNTRVLKLQAGEVDAIVFIPFNRVTELQGNPDLQVHLDPSSREDHILINHDHEPLGDVRVRHALYHAIDRQAIVDAVTFGHGKVANSFVPAGAMFYNPDNPDYPYDLEKAKALLKEAGVEGLSLRFLLTAGDSVHDQIGVIVKDQLAKVGIDVELVKQEEGQQWESTVAGEYDISVNYWTNDIIDPDQKATFSVYGDDENRSYYTGYKNPEVAKLVEQGRVELDRAKREDIYRQIQEIAKRDAHWIDLYYSPFRNASRKNVQNFYQNPMGRFMLEDTSLQ